MDRRWVTVSLCFEAFLYGELQKCLAAAKQYKTLSEDLLQSTFAYVFFEVFLSSFSIMISVPLVFFGNRRTKMCRNANCRRENCDFLHPEEGSEGVCD